MFVPKSQVQDIARYRRQWFEAPWNFPSTCKALSEWKRSDCYKLINNDMSVEFVEGFLENYELMIQEWVSNRIRSRTGTTRSSMWDEPSVFGYEFTLRGWKPKPAEAKALQEAVDETRLMLRMHF